MPQIAAAANGYKIVRCLDSDGHLCKECFRYLKRETLDREPADGQAPGNGKIHGPLPETGVEAAAHAIRDAGYRGPILQQTPVRLLRGKHGRYTGYVNCYPDLAIVDNGFVFIQVDGKEHESGERQNMDETQDPAIMKEHGVPVFRLSTTGEGWNNIVAAAVQRAAHANTCFSKLVPEKSRKKAKPVI